MPTAESDGDAPPLQLRTWVVVVLVACAYIIGAGLAFLALNATTIVVLFLPAGVTSSALILTPRRQWPWILAAVACCEVFIDVSQGQSLQYVWGFALANTLEPLLGVVLLRRFVPGRVNLHRRRDLVAFLCCCVGIAPVLGAVIGAATIAIGQGGAFLSSVPAFWAGDALGVLTVGGTVLTARPYREWDRSVAARWFLAVLAMVCVTALAFWPAEVPLFYLPLPLLFWLAFDHGLALTISSGLAMTVTANLMTAAGRGPWAAMDTSPPLKAATLQLFLGISVIGAWLLAVGVAERDNARLDTSAERAARRRLNALQAVTARVATAATTDDIATLIVRGGVAIIADHGVAAVCGPDGQEVTTWATYPSAGIQQYHPVGLDDATALARVIGTGTSIVAQNALELEAEFPYLAETYRAAGIHSGLCVPIPGPDFVPLGALAMGFRAEYAIDEDVTAFAEALASLAGQAVGRAQLYEQQVDAAHQLQHALLPVLVDGLPGVEAAAEYRPAERSHEVGGDWYDVFALPDGRIAFAVGDVVGHDLAAAAAMARLQVAVRIVAPGASGPAEVLDRLDESSETIANAWMTTVGYGEYDPMTGLLRYACAGHPPPMLVTDDRAEFLWEGRSLPIGVVGLERTEASLTIAAGSTLVWYSDGLVERPGEALRLGLGRLAEVARELGPADPKALCPAVLQRLREEQSTRDDTVVLCLRLGRIGAAAPNS